MVQKMSEIQCFLHIYGIIKIKEKEKNVLFFLKMRNHLKNEN